MIKMLVASSFLFPCGCYSAATVSASVIEKELLLFYLSLQCIQFVPYWPVLPHIMIHFFLFVWPVLYYICLPPGEYSHMLFSVSLLWICTLASSLKCLWHSCLHSFLQFSSLFFLCGSCRTASPQFTGLG